MKFYFKYVKPHLKYFIIGPVLMLTEVLGELLLPYLFSLLINNGIPDGDTGYIIRIGLMMVAFTAVMLIGGLGGSYLNTNAAIGFAADLRADTFRKVQAFSFSNIDSFNTGSLVTRLTNDITQLQNIIRMGLIMLFRAPGMLIGGLVMAVRINMSLAAIIAVVIPILAVLLFFIIKHGFPRFEIMQKKIDSLNSSVQESLTNVRVIKSFVRGEAERERFAKANRGLKESSLSAYSVVILIMPLMTLMMNLTTLAVVWFGGRQIIAGDMPVGDLTAFTSYIVQILMSLVMLSMVLLQSSRAAASAKRIREVAEAEIDLNDGNAAQKEKKVELGKIEFKNVSFKYYRDKPEYVLENISLTVEPGQTLGIIGSTGSGKTSLVQLIPRLYDTYEGDVLVDGINVKDYSLKNLRNGVGMVLQKNVLFSGTIQENLEWGDEDAEDGEVRGAASAAQAHDFISGFSEGYGTELDQGGVNLSGGQKQRLCIARALLKKPKILILDDSTSAVDTATEARIRESFQTSLKDTTKLIIAQRITSVAEADQILVLDDGNVAGIGSHASLIESCKAYREIYYSQTDGEAGAQ